MPPILAFVFSKTGLIVMASLAVSSVLGFMWMKMEAQKRGYEKQITQLVDENIALVSSNVSLQSAVSQLENDKNILNRRLEAAVAAEKIASAARQAIEVTNRELSEVIKSIREQDDEISNVRIRCASCDWLRDTQDATARNRNLSTN